MIDKIILYIPLNEKEWPHTEHECRVEVLAIVESERDYSGELNTHINIKNITWLDRKPEHTLQDEKEIAEDIENMYWRSLENEARNLV